VVRFFGVVRDEWIGVALMVSLEGDTRFFVAVDAASFSF
jgi:hypothetical protein